MTAPPTRLDVAQEQRLRYPLGTVLRVGIVACVVLAFVLVSAGSRSGVGWRLTTFTYQVNVVAGVYYLWSLFSPRHDSCTGGVRGAVVLYVVVAGTVWNLFLTEMSMGYSPANILLHIVVPVLALLDWVLVGRSQGRVRWWQPFAWLLYPVAYLGLALVVLNSLGRRAPYYFLDPAMIGGPTLVRNIVLLAVGFVALGYVLAGVGKASVVARRSLTA